MSQTSPFPVLFQRLWRLLRYMLFALVGLIALYAVGRLIDVSLGSFYSGDRAPYLQMAADTAMTIRWQSRDRHTGVVKFGRDRDRLAQEIREQQPMAEHELRLTGLQPLTEYYYRVSNSNDTFGELQHFSTAAPAGSDVSVRFWVTGDQGYRGPIQTDVTTAAWQWLEAHARQGRGLIDFWLTTGDNAYRSGSNEQFQDNFFQPYAEILSRYPVWPGYGNHDARRWAFFDIFSFPGNAESGGTASHTEHYYSFDYGPLHVVMLDTQASDLSADGKMARWLVADLKATQQPWRIAVSHHPAYTKGSHDSDRPGDSGGRIFEVRENILPILERYGVALVMSGHSHMYERSHAIACHYTDSSGWQTRYIKDQDSPYTQGSVYMIVGSSSKLDDGPLNHPALPVARHESGSVIIDVKGNTLTSRFINQQGKVSDQFRISQDQTNSIPGSPRCE